MIKQRAFLKPLQNNRGMLTAEFIFSIVLCAGLCIVLFSLNFTLSMAEVAQYIAFSSARAHAAGHVDIEKQEQLGREKFTELINNPVLKPIFNATEGGWFKLTDLEVRGGGPSGRSFNDEYKTTENRMPQVGVRFNFKARILNMKVPFLGATSEDPDAGFNAKVTGLLIREPTQKECRELQIRQRYTAILDLDPRYKILGASGANKYQLMEDNGC
ncbi:hypothetical protein ACES2L_00515 [Bdellovibrio bacteriovorus]